MFNLFPSAYLGLLPMIVPNKDNAIWSQKAPWQWRWCFSLAPAVYEASKCNLCNTSLSRQLLLWQNVGKVSQTLTCFPSSQEGELWGGTPVRVKGREKLWNTSMNTTFSTFNLAFHPYVIIPTCGSVLKPCDCLLVVLVCCISDESMSKPGKQAVSL